MSKTGYKTVNRVGEKFGRLIILSYPNINEKYVKKTVECLCDCGSKVIIQETSVVSGKTTSCGCFKYEVNISKGDGRTKTNLYRIYYSIKSRCFNKNDKGYINYGGRGITICKEWLNDFKEFYNWAMVNGWVKGVEIDRINNDGNYEPSNCRFITKRKNGNNKRNTILLTFNGETKPLTEWADIIGIKQSTLRSRIQERKMTVDEAFQNKKLYKGLITKKRFYNNQ